MATFAALLAVVLAWGLVSGRLGRYSITLPIVLVVVGALLSATGVVMVELNSESLRVLVERLEDQADELANAIARPAGDTDRSSCWWSTTRRARHDPMPDRPASPSPTPVRRI